MYAADVAHSVTNGNMVGGSSMFSSMSELRQKNKEIGHLFFNRDIMRHWGSKIETGLYRGIFFVTSEKRLSSQKRKYKIRKAAPNGAIETVGKVGGYDTLDDAKDAVKILIKELRILKPLAKAR